MTIDDWMEQVFHYQGNGYPLGGGNLGAGSAVEEVPNDYLGYIQAAYKSSGIVFACMVARQLAFSEARFQFQQLKQGRPADLFGSPELAVLEKPWPSGQTGDLLSRAIQHADLAGNHYAVRNSGRIRWLRPDWTEIILTRPPDEAVECDVAGYLYKPGGTQDKDRWKLYPVDGSHGRVAHWAPIPDPEALYRGMSPLTPVLREIASDKAATKHKGKFFENAATPALAVSFKETVTKTQFEQFMRAMDEAHSGVENAYSTLYLGGGADVTPLTYDMRQLDFKNTQGGGETRIAAALRVHPVVVGLSEGMQGSSLNAGNFKAAKDAFADLTMRPLWRSLCGAYEELVTPPKGSRLWYDDRDIAFLQDDMAQLAEIQTKQATTITKLIQDGYTPESIIEAVRKSDWTLLEHTGLFSVQLQPPLPNGPPVDGATVGPASGAKPTPLQNKAAKAAKAAAPAPKPGTGSTAKPAPKPTPKP
ncbi:phage portal protein [Streptomyces microflavus]|uniref:phage portal protein n=1 Tax=Streptomyces microflavus TaxID=1919 RepID=UPI00367D9CFD